MKYMCDGYIHDKQIFCYIFCRLRCGKNYKRKKYKTAM